ncbi:LSU ribosomal protein L22p (L17e) [[Mycoplasma] cavipharyngis]|uniref:50S ribosomal protein L22 n=1 Tax=[Mycoplasma] cavipharyngis TaxID=92757 RepID=UPI00370465AA
MLAKAIQRNVRVSAKKATLVCALIRNQNVKEAFKILDHSQQKTATFLKKLLGSAVANAVNNHAMNGNDLYVYSVVANQGPTYKRNMPRAKGRSDIMRKRSSHLEVIVSDNPNEKTESNKKLLKPRAHQHKYQKDQLAQKAIVVEKTVVNTNKEVK